MLELFNQSDFIIFSTRQFAGKTGLSMSAASKKLSRLAAQGLLCKMTKGVWANKHHHWFTPEALVPYFLGKEQGCVSFLSVLHSTGALSQIPQKIQVATTGHSRQLMSPVGRFEFIQMKPELITIGCDWSSTKLPYLHSTIEKALFDCLYISTRKLKRFSRMPELDLQESGFSEEIFYALINEVGIPERIKSAIRTTYKTIST